MLHQTFVNQRQLEQARRVQDVVLAVVPEHERQSAHNQAARLMVSGRFREAIAAYEAIAESDPERCADAQAQIGAGWYFLGDLERAIGYYEMARLNGADPDTMRENIEEARAELARRADPAVPVADEDEDLTPTDLLVTLALVGAVLMLVAALLAAGALVLGLGAALVLV